ncbi:hypothetical protein FRC10_004101 [Ceratobasidium sp. 414]|nr:hypothetical protein FRC10_004101 [Ceratobasidium sp. 414]
MDKVPEKEAWDRVMALNVKSLFYSEHSFHATAISQQGNHLVTSNLTELLSEDATALDPGRVVNISSVGSISALAENVWSRGFPTMISRHLANSGQIVDSATKAAVNHPTSTMAVSLAPKFITVNAILPGFYPSRATAYVYDKNAEKLNKSHPTGRVGSPRNMAGLLLFLVSPGGAHVTGVHIVTDGGARISGIKLKL